MAPPLGRWQTFPVMVLSSNSRPTAQNGTWSETILYSLVHRVARDGFGPAGTSNSINPAFCRNDYRRRQCMLARLGAYGERLRYGV